jgi:hypothetical protein
MNNSQSHRLRTLVLVLPTLVLAAGCHKEYNDPTKLQSTAASHQASFNEVESLKLPGSSLPDAGPSIGDADPDYYVDENGHRVPKSYYIIYCDIYWRLNWIRQQLRHGIVPERLGDKIENVRKELTQATAGIAHDGNYRVAHEALTFLESGWNHYEAEQALADGGVQSLSAPWSSGAVAMRTFIDAGGFGFGVKPVGAASIPAPGASDDPLTQAAAGTPVGADTANLTPRQERAIEVAVRYAGEYHRSPRDCAQDEWSRAVERINKLRDQLWMMNKANSKDNGTAVDVRPSSDIGSAAGDFHRTGNAYTKNGTDLPGTSAPTSDPFQSASPSAPVQPSRSARGADSP